MASPTKTERENPSAYSNLMQLRARHLEVQERKAEIEGLCAKIRAMSSNGAKGPQQGQDKQAEGSNKRLRS